MKVKICIRKKEWFWMLVAFLSCIPAVFYKNEFLSSKIGYINLLMLFASAIVFLEYIRFRCYRVHCVSFGLIICLGFSILLSDFWNGTFNVAYLYRLARIIMFCSVIIIAYKKNMIRVLIHSWAVYFEFLVIINVCSQIIFPAGFAKITYTEWLPIYVIGAANSCIFYYLLTSTLICMDSFLNGNKIGFNFAFVTGIELVSVVLGGSTTALLVILLYISGTFFLFFPSVTAFLTRHIRAIIIAFVLFFVTVIVYQSELITGTIIGATGEAHSFSERMFIWAQVTSRIAEHPIIGYGSLNDAIVYDYKGYFRTAHNCFLQICQMGGVIALTFYLAVFTRSVIKVGKEYRSANQSYIKKIMGILIFTFICFACVFMVEQNVYFSGFYGICVLSECIIHELNKEDCRVNE